VLKYVSLAVCTTPGHPVVAMFVSLLTRRSSQHLRLCVRSFGGQGSIVSVDNLEDVVGGHIWVALILIGGGIFHVLTKPLLGRVALTFGLEKHSYSLGAVSLIFLQFRLV